MVYKWKTRKYKISAETAATEINSCADDGGYIAPSAVVDKARDESNPLHVCFEWDDATAAQKHREQEARVLMANIVTVVEADSGNSEPVRAYIHVRATDDDEDDSGYKSIVTVLQSASDTSYMLSQAKRELESFKHKYNALSALKDVFTAINKVLDTPFAVEAKQSKGRKKAV